MQRRLTGLGFDIKASGKFDENTRAVITRWQAARGYPKSGYLNALQHKALQSEILAHPRRRVRATTDDERRCVIPVAAAAVAAAATITVAAVAAPRSVRRHDGRTVRRR